MTIKQRIGADFLKAFKEKDLLRKSVLSILQSEMKNREIELKNRETGLDDQEAIKVLRRAIKQRKESAAVYRTGGRTELAEKEEAEAKIIGEYLPAEMNEAEIKAKIGEIIAKFGAVNKKDFGKVMGLAMKEFGSTVDGTKVKQIVEELLS